MLSQKIRSLTFAAALSIASLVPCGVGRCETPVAHGPITIGVSAPMTGDLAEYGAAVKQGIDLAISEAEPSFRNLQFVFEDNQYESAKAVSALQKLKNVDAVSLVYTWGEAPLHSIAPIAERQRIPVVAMSLDPGPAIGKRYIIRSINYSEQYAIKTLDYLRSKGLKRLGIINTEDPFFNSMITGLKKHLTQGETLEVVAAVTPDEQDFKPQIAKLKTRQFDAVGVYLLSGQVSQFYRQSKSFDFKTPTFGTDVFESASEIAQAQGGMNGAFYPNIEVPKGFVDTYVKRYGNDTQIAYAYNAYCFAKLSSVLLRDASQKITSDQIVELYTNPPKDLGFRFSESKDGGKFYEFPIVIKQIRGNGIETAS